MPNLILAKFYFLIHEQISFLAFMSFYVIVVLG